MNTDYAKGYDDGMMVARKAAETDAKMVRDKPKVYIAGPVSGVEGFRRNFYKAQGLLMRAGYEGVDPTAPGLVDGWEYRDYINRGLRLLEECDLICMLPGSKNSPGAQLELHYAVLCGLPIMHISDDYRRILGVDMTANYEG